MKAWPIDPLVFRNLKLEVSEKLPQGTYLELSLRSCKMPGYRPRSLLSLAESPDTDPPLGETLPPASRGDRPVNLLSDRAVDELIRHAVQNSRLREVSVETGGRDPVSTYASYLASSGQSQFRVSEEHCGTAWREIFRDLQERDPARLLTVPLQFKVNLAQLVWRYRHRTADGAYRKLPVSLEVSHQAEAYHADGLFPGLLWGERYRTGYKIELSNLETAEVNESRKVCNEQALMWRKPDTGELIPLEEVQSYRGPTQCHHAALGIPCYAPYPAGEDAATLRTPKKNRGKRSRTGRGSLEGTAKVAKGGGLIDRLNRVAKSS